MTGNLQAIGSATGSPSRPPQQATIYGIRQATMQFMTLFFVFAGASALAILITVISKREMEVEGASKAERFVDARSSLVT